MQILNVRIDNVSQAAALEKIKEFLHSPGQKQIATVNPEFIITAQSNAIFRQTLNNSALNTVDGFGIKLVGWLRGQNLRRCTGVDLIQALFRTDFINKEKVFLLGGRPGVAAGLEIKLKREQPNLAIVGAAAGFNDINQPLLVEYNEIIAKINKAAPTILLVAYNAPFAQIFIADWLDKMPSVKVAIGVGGTFDFLAGKIKRAPRIFSFLGLEWLWRWFRQPQRYYRIYQAVVKFLILAWQEQKRNKV